MSINTLHEREEEAVFRIFNLFVGRNGEAIAVNPEALREEVVNLRKYGFDVVRNLKAHIAGLTAQRDELVKKLTALHAIIPPPLPQCYGYSYAFKHVAFDALVREMYPNFEIRPIPDSSHCDCNCEECKRLGHHGEQSKTEALLRQQRRADRELMRQKQELDRKREIEQENT